MNIFFEGPKQYIKQVLSVHALIVFKRFSCLVVTEIEFKVIAGNFENLKDPH